MTKAQKENQARFKQAQEIAKDLKLKNKNLKHTNAVKKAFEIMQTDLKKVKINKTKKISGVFKFGGVNFNDIRQYDIYGNLSYIIEDNNGKQIIIIDGNFKNIEKQSKQLNNYIDNYSNFNQYSKKSQLIAKDVLKFVKLLSKEIRDYNNGKTKTVKPIKNFSSVSKIILKKPIIKKEIVKKQTGTSNKLYDARIQALKPGKRLSKEGNVYYENRQNRSDKGKLLGVKNNNIKLQNIRLTRVNNDFDGNSRYVVHFLDLLNEEENSFLPFNKMYDYAIKKSKIINGKKFNNKSYGGGIVFQTSNLDDLKKNIINVKNTSPKIKY